MTTLHGKEIKVGDKVWSTVRGWEEVIAIDAENPYPIITGKSSYTTEGRYLRDIAFVSLFWQEMMLVPKPEPKYEWQFLYNCEGAPSYFIASKLYYESEEAIREELNHWPERTVIRIEESKREVK